VTRTARSAKVGLVFSAAYVADGIIAKRRGANAIGQVHVNRYYAVPLKDGKTEMIPLDPETDTCVHAVFPHFGYAPCWRVEGQKEKRIDM